VAGKDFLITAKTHLKDGFVIHARQQSPEPNPPEAVLLFVIRRFSQCRWQRQTGFRRPDSGSEVVNGFRKARRMQGSDTEVCGRGGE